MVVVFLLPLLGAGYRSGSPTCFVDRVVEMGTQSGNPNPGYSLNVSASSWNASTTGKFPLIKSVPGFPHCVQPWRSNSVALDLVDPLV